MASLLYEVSATDPLTYLAIAAVVNRGGIPGLFYPGEKATKVDPLVALRITSEMFLECGDLSPLWLGARCRGHRLSQCCK